MVIRPLRAAGFEGRFVLESPLALPIDFCGVSSDELADPAPENPQSPLFRGAALRVDEPPGADGSYRLVEAR